MVCCPKLLLSWNTIMFQREREGGWGKLEGSGWEIWDLKGHRRDWHSILQHQKHYEQVQDGRMCQWAPGLPLMLRPITVNVSSINKDDGQRKTGKRLNKNVLLIYLTTLWLLRGHYDVRSCTVRGNIYSTKRLSFSSCIHSHWNKLETYFLLTTSLCVVINGVLCMTNSINQ